MYLYSLWAAINWLSVSLPAIPFGVFWTPCLLNGHPFAKHMHNYWKYYSKNNKSRCPISKSLFIHCLEVGGAGAGGGGGGEGTDDPSHTSSSSLSLLYRVSSAASSSSSPAMSGLKANNSRPVIWNQMRKVYIHESSLINEFTVVPITIHLYELLSQHTHLVKCLKTNLSTHFIVSLIRKWWKYIQIIPMGNFFNDKN